MKNSDDKEIPELNDFKINELEEAVENFKKVLYEEFGKLAVPFLDIINKLIQHDWRQDG